MKKRKKLLYRVFLQLQLSAFLCGCLALSGCSREKAEILIQDFQEETAQAEEEGSSDTGKRKNSGDTAKNSTDTEESESRNTKAEDVQEMGMQSEDQNQIPDETSAGEQQAVMIYVDVCGAVVNPGVFALEEGSRVFQAVEAAGGYLPQAAQACINRAQILTDGQQIYILTQEEMEQQGIQPGESQTASGTVGDFSGQSDSADRQDKRVNINTADESQLTALTGIGSTRAQAIIAYRESEGPFSSIEEIMNVQGIKEGTFAKIKDEIVVE